MECVYTRLIVHIAIERNVNIEEKNNDMLWNMVQQLSQIGIYLIMTIMIIILYVQHQ